MNVTIEDIERNLSVIEDHFKNEPNIAIPASLDPKYAGSRLTGGQDIMGKRYIYFPQPDLLVLSDVVEFVREIKAKEEV